MAESSLARAGRALVLIGGVTMVIVGGLTILGQSSSLPIPPFLSQLRFPVFLIDNDFLTLILGILAIIGSRFTDQLEWAIALIIVGLIGSGVGGMLVSLGGLLGLILALTQHTQSKKSRLRRWFKL